MHFITGWIKNNKIAAILILVIGYLVLKDSSVLYSISNSRTYSTPYSKGVGLSDSDIYSSEPSAIGTSQLASPELAPAPNVPDRMVAYSSHLSLLVKNVSDSVEMIKSHAQSFGGYMINANVSNPNDAANGEISIRVPSKTLPETLTFLRSLSVKVVSENLSGTDVTDEYEDVEEKLNVLKRNKARIEEIMASAKEVSDIISIQNQVFSVQNQIDSLIGRKNYLEKTSEMSVVTIFMSTDELSLPYTPEQSWRPAVIFKYAVRSLLTKLQQLGTILIYVGVYSIVWLPTLGAILLLRKRFLKK